MTALTKRWTKLDHHPEQYRLWHSPARFIVAPPGRRSGKSEIMKRKLIKRAISFTDYDDGHFYLAAPTRPQAKKIFWRDAKKLVPDWAKRGRPSEGELVIPLVNGAEIVVVGMDEPARIEGDPIDGILLDEYANMKKAAWHEHVRPAVATRNRLGFAWMIGVPEGRTHYYKLYKQAQEMHALDPDGPWDTFHWVSADILDPSEIEEARNSLDPRIFRQEFEGSFENFAGQAYYDFNRTIHANERLTDHYYDPREPLNFCFDFNWKPGVACVNQEAFYRGENLAVPRSERVTMWLGEVWIPEHSNSRRVAEAVLSHWKYHQGPVRLFGDATGGAKGSAKVDGSDWDLIEDVLRPHFRDRLQICVPKKNPKEKVRVNAMNSRIKSASGAVRQLWDPSCKHFIEDMEGVTTIEGTNGELLKEKGSDLTHMSDAGGYYVVKEFPYKKKGGGAKELVS